MTSDLETDAVFYVHLGLPCQVDNREVVVEVTDVKQTAYIYACSGSTIQVGFRPGRLCINSPDPGFVSLGFGVSNMRRAAEVRRCGTGGSQG